MKRALLLLALAGCGPDRSFAYCLDKGTLFEHWAAGTFEGGKDGRDDSIACNAPRGCVQTPAPVCYQNTVEPVSPGSQ